MVDESLSGDLTEFRQKWKEELTEENKTGNKGEKQPQQFIATVVKKDLSSSKAKCRDFSNAEEELHSFDERTNEKTKTSNEIKKSEVILLNLPDPENKTNNKDNFRCVTNKKFKTEQTDENKCANEYSKTSLLEQLISDIDEITAIPFFDLQLPKEVGIKILSHLTMWDLCQCSVVSKAWRQLADDDLLWFNAGVNEGFVSKEHHIVLERTNWKVFIRDCVVRNRQLQQRWKERICQINTMEYERGGSLSTVSAWNHLICTGYSTGNVLLWNIEGHDGPTYKIMEPILNGQERPCITCTAVNDNLCVAGFDNGSVNIWHTSLLSSPVHNCSTEGSVKMVAIATDKEPTVVSACDTAFRVDVADQNGQWSCRKQKSYENKISHMNMLPSSSSTDFHRVVIATRDTIQLYSTSMGSNATLIDHVIGGKIACLDGTVDTLAVGVGPYGYGVLGNKVRLYRPDTGQLTSLLSGHYHEITCLNLRDSPPNRLVTGSYDKRVRLFDLRTEALVLTLRGHEDYITTVQMDDWKVVSGSHDGMTCVWDQRMGSAMLWSARARHPVRYCRFDRVQMLTANIPDDRRAHEDLWYADDLILHRKNRGMLRLFDFETENATVGVPDICLSNYDDTAGYNYNIALVTPYDAIDE